MNSDLHNVEQFMKRREGAFYYDPGPLWETGTGAAWVYEVTPKKVFGFGKGEPFSQTRWRF